jgi:Ca-activated chloride channel family protein
MWPLAWGYWLLIVALVALLLCAGTYIYQYVKRRTAKRKALKQLQTLDTASEQYCMHAQVLLKNLFTHYFGQQNNLNLHGQQWRDKLLSTYKGNQQETFGQALVHIDQALYAKAKGDVNSGESVKASVSARHAAIAISLEDWIKVACRPQNQARNNPMFEFAWWPLLFIIPLPLIVRLVLPAKTEDSKVALYFPHISQLHEGKTKTNKRSIKRLSVMSIAWICLVLAAARPLWFGEPVAIPSEGRDLMLAVDLSGSMQQTDMQVNGRQVDRLEMVKSVMDDFIERRVGDRLGLILFGDTAYLQTPLTFDRAIVKQFLDESVIGLVGDSTAIGDAIGLAVKRFTEKERSNRVLILLTDGRNTAGNINVEQALSLAVSNEVTIYAIGVGADQKVQRGFLGSRVINPSMDLDERTLTNIAKETGGEYFRARSAEELAQIYQILDMLEPVEGSEQTLRPREELFYFPLIAALSIVSLIAIWPLLVNLIRRVSKRSYAPAGDSSFKSAQKNNGGTQ